MTLNGVMYAILRYLTAFGSFGGKLGQSGEDRPILCAKKCSQKNLLVGNYEL